jgi:hypothetical protein
MTDCSEHRSVRFNVFLAVCRETIEYFLALRASFAKAGISAIRRAGADEMTPEKPLI